ELGFHTDDYTGGQPGSLAGFKNRTDIGLIQSRVLLLCSAQCKSESNQESDQNRQLATVHLVLLSRRCMLTDKTIIVTRKFRGNPQPRSELINQNATAAH